MLKQSPTGRADRGAHPLVGRRPFRARGGPYVGFPVQGKSDAVLEWGKSSKEAFEGRAKGCGSPPS